jgi:hypothetical protein
VTNLLINFLVFIFCTPRFVPLHPEVTCCWAIRLTALLACYTRAEDPLLWTNKIYQ